MSNTAIIKSPCINKCSLNPKTGICIGCYRTIDEIAGWAMMSNEQRLAVIKKRAIRQKEVKKNGDNR